MSDIDKPHRMWLGAGAQSAREYVFPYSLFRGAIDPILDIVRAQLKRPTYGDKGSRDE